ncbi:IS3 family transposase [Acholeplasma hippikon]
MLTRYSVYRYMRLNQVQSIIRKKKFRWGARPHIKIPNLLKRDFTTERPNEKWSIDISYLFCKERILYLCAIKNMYDKSIVSYKISRFMSHDFVLNTVKMAISDVPQHQRLGLIIHSDQGAQFTSQVYSNLLKENNIKQSASFKGSCVDNSPIESWFSSLKSECVYLNDKMSESEMILKVEDYIKYYNEVRLQKKIKELAPIQYRKQALSRFFI